MDLTNKLRVFTAFSGYDSQCMALDRLGINYDLVGWSEIDKYAIQAHNAVYPQWANRNFGDISKIDWQQVPNFDLFTYSFPCTDISSAGQQKGLTEGSGTRSSLLWKCRKTIEIKKPKYLLMENVKALTSEKFMPYLRKWLLFLENLGYNNFTKVLNAKDYGVPQNRERVFVVSIYGDERYYYPRPFKLEKLEIDVLESNVDEIYFLSKKVLNTFMKRNEKNRKKNNGFEFKPTDGNVIASSILTNAGSRDCDNYIIVAAQYLKTIANLTRKEECDVTINSDMSLRPYVKDKHKSGISELQTDYDMSVGSTLISARPNFIYGQTTNYRIRKLTPRECFRLMGVSEENIDKIQAAGISKNQQYKMAGNSIVVDVLYHIFRKLFIEKECESKQLSLF